MTAAALKGKWCRICNASIAFKNASISVDQIERFYARNLPLSKEIAINLQRFGSES
jgi:hypothetical protein